MTNDYLWDKSGEPEADVAELERLLGRYRSTHARAGVAAPTLAVLAASSRLPRRCGRSRAGLCRGRMARSD